MISIRNCSWIKFSFSVATAIALTVGGLHAQAIWNNSGDGLSWSDAANWSTSSVPTSGTDVQIGAVPTVVPGLIAVDTGSAVTIASLAFNASLTSGVTLAALSGETLQVNGGIQNLSGSLMSLGLQTISGANATYAGGAGGISFSDLTVGLRTIGATGTITVGGTLVFDINSTSSFGSIGAIDANGANIAIGGTYTGSFGDSFDLTAGNFLGATLGTLPTLSGGLSWDTSNFLSDGVLTVVPEPTTAAMMVGAFSLLALRRRRD